MKFIFSFMLICTALATAQTLPKQSEEEPIKEYVSVTNVELLLRVINEKKTIGGFQKEDFILLEDGKERPINGFFELKKQMRSHADKGLQARPLNGRLFLLFFWATQSQTVIRPHLDAFFEQVYLPQDRVILLSNESQFEIKSPADIPSVREQFEHSLQTEIEKKRTHWNAIHRDISFEIESMINLIRLNRNLNEVIKCLNEFVTKYAQFVKEIEIMSKDVDFKKMNPMTDSLKHIIASKWALIFFEPPQVPVVDIFSLKSQIENVIVGDDMGTIVSTWFKKMADIEMQLAQLGNQSGLYEKTKSQFINADTVFHFINMVSPSYNTINKADEDPFIAFKPISSRWENVLKSISRATGGQIGKIESDPTVLNNFFDSEDISYLITYVPLNSKKQNRKITIKFRNPNSPQSTGNLIFGRQIELDKTPAVQIDRIVHYQDILTLTCSQFYPIQTEKGPQGHLQVQIVAQLKDSEPLTLFSGQVEYSEPLKIPLALPQPGEWELMVLVTDSMTTLSTSQKHHLSQFAVRKKTDDSLPTDGADPQLVSALEKAANYSEKLKKTALRFFCNEEITQKASNGKESPHFKRWQYDYQIILQDGRLDETRNPKGKKKKKDNQASVELKTLYKSHYSFFLPATFLSREKQTFYQYSVLDKQSVHDRPTLHIAAIPQNPQSGLPEGELWIDEDDGSVWQIKLNPASVKGFQNRYQTAEDNQRRITIVDIHEYFVRFNGLHFPSSTFISEYQELKENAKLPPKSFVSTDFTDRTSSTFYSVHYQYNTYRFFDIETNEKITGWVEE